MLVQISVMSCIVQVPYITLDFTLTSSIGLNYMLFILGMVERKLTGLCVLSLAIFFCVFFVLSGICHS